LRLHAGSRCLHFQRRETCVDRMRAIGLGHTAGRYIGVADRLDFLESVAGDDVVERGKVPVKKTNQRCGLRSLRQERETLNVCK
jgi:hypothetical protein